MNDTNVILEVKNLKKTFGDHVVLKDINTTITKGEVIAIILQDISYMRAMTSQKRV